MRRPRNFLLLVLLTIATVELVAYVALRATGTYPQRSFREQYATTGCLKTDAFNYGRYAQNRDGLVVMLGKVPHPYFGFVTNQEDAALEERRDQVGPDFENELRYEVSLGRDPRPASELTIGIFGASVAVSFAEHVMRDDEFAAALRARIPALRDRTIVLRNMAVGASRQPAQLAIATHYLELFDLTINLDGYSEQAIEMYPEYPIEYPMFGDVFFGRGGTSRYLELRSVEVLCGGISAAGQSALLRRSNAYYLFWYVASAWLKQTFQTQAPASSGETPQYSFTPDDVRGLHAAYYERYTRYQHQLSTANGVRSYFFLQPNQYVPDSKPFSDAERSGALNRNGADETAARYTLLREKIRGLAAEGVPAYDLTGVFAGERDTVYVDVCCHVNERGNDLIADAIVDAIADAENLRMGPGARTR